MAADGSVLISLGHLNQVILIAPDSGPVRWRLGGPGSAYTFGRPARPLLRAVELELDLQRMVARRVWEYWHRPPLYAACCSGVPRLHNGNTLILYESSRAECYCRVFIIVEVAPDGRTVWEVGHRSPGKPSQYRVYAAESIMGEAHRRSDDRNSRAGALEGRNTFLFTLGAIFLAPPVSGPATHRGNPEIPQFWGRLRPDSDIES